MCYITATGSEEVTTADCTSAIYQCLYLTGYDVITNMCYITATGSEEVTTADCTSAQSECRVLTDLVRCDYGVERWVDADTCERCRCADPCQGYTCPDGTRCAVDQHRSQFRPVCRLSKCTYGISISYFGLMRLP
jgi:hypothetical protein